MSSHACPLDLCTDADERDPRVRLKKVGLFPWCGDVHRRFRPVCDVRLDEHHIPRLGPRGLQLPACG